MANEISIAFSRGATAFAKSVDLPLLTGVPLPAKGQSLRFTATVESKACELVLDVDRVMIKPAVGAKIQCSVAYFVIDGVVHRDVTGSTTEVEIIAGLGFA